MGMRLFAADGIFWPSENGVYPGDVVNVILVAGGNRGATTTVIGGDLGGDSSFGSYAAAFAGKGAPGALTRTAAPYTGAGAGGGFIPGAPFQGGPGRNAYILATTVQPNVFLNNSNGGGAMGPYTIVVGADGCNFGGASCGTTYRGEGGGGYGAGGGADGNSATQRYAGNAGQILYYTHIITEDDMTNGIPITIGAGYSTIGTALTTMSATGIVTGVKNVGESILQPAIYGTYGVSKTFELADGTYGMSPCGSVNSVPSNTSYVKFPGVDSIFSYSRCFPGFINSYQYPVFYCNGYYICLYQMSSTVLRVYWVLEAAAKTGAPTSGQYGYVEYAVSSYCMPGANATDLVIATTTTHLDIYSNWTPASTTPTSTSTLGNALIALSSTNFLFPFSSVGFNQVKCEQNQAGTGTYARITNYLTGTTTTQTLCLYAFFNQGISDYFGCAHYYDAWMYGIRYFSATTNNTYPSNNIYFWFGTTIMRAVAARPNSSYGYNFIPVKGDKVGLDAQYYHTRPITTGYAPWSYDNHPAYPDSGDGAGGCCIISW